ncbi:50S ribosomal protein L25/general stress protein Ctc [Klugiella xanthotipulae]|uniref:Large ribosomal subunit protein bL25 n=1 Tax=Klugiella xanthotipulae TaxID=244735 RepID=A0A543HY70_9MICO|nr:50S ribosomal protein L25/general stress protein Ctc [Klugiella xanthotipulae]TQM63195.1 LSU ribosomal protein L25P [Klugiella xanthotipulae]
MSDDTNKVSAELREKFGKGAARKLRAAGKIPAVIYGHGTEPQHVTLPGHEVGLIIRKANAVLTLDIDGVEQLTLVKDVQRDPVLQIVEHIDLIVVKKGELVEAEVPVHVEGESYPGTLAMLELNTLRLLVEATHIPENVVARIDGLVEGDQIHAGAIQLPTGAKLADDADLLIVNIVVPRSGTAADDAAEEAAAE